MTKLGRFLSGQIVANTKLQNKQDLPTVCRSLLSVQPTLCFVVVVVVCFLYVCCCCCFLFIFLFVFGGRGGGCQTNSKAPKVEQVFLHATCNNHSFVVLFVD